MRAQNKAHRKSLRLRRIPNGKAQNASMLLGDGDLILEILPAPKKRRPPPPLGNGPSHVLGDRLLHVLRGCLWLSSGSSASRVS